MKIKKRYRLIVTDESRLQDVWSLRLTTRRGILLSVGVVLAAVVLAAVLIMVTPLRSLLPGYMKEHQRADFIEALLKLDSLQNEYDRNQAFLRNITLVFDTDRVPTDSASMTKPDSVNVVDTIMPTSVEEQEFIKMMKEREKYNASILAPLAAEGLLFTSPCPGAVISEQSHNSTKARIIIPASGAISSVTDGTVIDTHYDTSVGSYSITIQHPKGFLSKYSHIGQPIIAKGQSVIAGQRIASATLPTGKRLGYMTLEMWRNGEALIPHDYILPHHVEGVDDEDL